MLIFLEEKIQTYDCCLYFLRESAYHRRCFCKAEKILCSKDLWAEKKNNHLSESIRKEELAGFLKTSTTGEPFSQGEPHTLGNFSLCKF